MVLFLCIFIHDSEYFLDVNLKCVWKALKIDDFIFLVWRFRLVVVPCSIYFIHNFSRASSQRRFVASSYTSTLIYLDIQVCYCEWMPLFHLHRFMLQYETEKAYLSTGIIGWMDTGFDCQRLTTYCTEYRLPIRCNSESTQKSKNFHGNVPSINDTRYVYRLKLSKNRRRW